MTPIHVKNDTSRPDWPLKGFDTFLISEGPNDKSIIKASRSQQLVVRAECNVLHRSSKECKIRKENTHGL